jgi:acetyl-CoA acetyltransferase
MPQHASPQPLGRGETVVPAGQRGEGMSNRYAIAALGVTKQGTLPGTTSEGLAGDALELALTDGGLARKDVDGYIFQPGIGGQNTGRAATVAALNTNVVFEMQSGGATAILALAAAIGLLETGACTYVAVAHGTNARSRQVNVGGGKRSSRDPGAFFGMFSPAARAAMAARGYFARYGRSSADLAEIAVALRAHGSLRPDATMHGRPLTIEDHQSSAFVVDPLRTFDCCLVSDGGAALVVTTLERAKDLRSQPIEITGLGAAHSTGGRYRGAGDLGDADIVAEPVRSTVFGRAQVSVDDIDVFQFYDAFTILVAQQLEAYGLCGPGEAAQFVRAGNVRFDSARPCNTSGTEHSWSYLQGFTHIAEAVRQLRGEGGATQVRTPNLALVTGIGSTDAGISQAAAVLARA